MTDNELLLAISAMMDEKLKAENAGLHEEIQSIKEEIHSMRDEVIRNNIIMENEVVPRLQNIESCYTSTYTRYKRYSDKMEAVFRDVELLKKVVSEHSKALQKIS